MIGRVLSGRYVIEKKVGSGGMAVVYRAFDKIGRRTVAIKVLRSEYESDAEFVRRFSREAEAASKVSHENIVSMIDVGMDGDLRYIVMEYVDGKTLKDMIRERGHIDPDEALPMVIRILAAVDHAHRNGIVHRDIKPQNILVDSHGRVKVADFGIARLKAAQTTQLDGDNGAALGSVHYFAPEQARGEIADEKSDLYSVGIVLYEMLTGRVPFDGETAVSVAIKHIEEPPKSMRVYASGISKALDEVVMRALCKDPAQRYQTAAEMAADLRRSLRNPRGGFVEYPDAPDDKDREDPHRKNRRPLLGGMRVIVILTVLCAVLFGLYAMVGNRGRVLVPDVLGLEQKDAIDQMEALGMAVNVEPVSSETYDIGLVAAQEPEGGARVSDGATVTLHVSSGSDWFTLDNYVGRTEAEVASDLADEDVTVEFEYVLDENESPGTVLAQTTDPGLARKKSTVRFTVVGRAVTVPNVVGLRTEGAQALIEAEGLSVGEITVLDTLDAPSDRVLEQTIPAGSKALPGTEISMTASPRQDEVYTPFAPFTVAVPLDNLDVDIILRTPSGEEVSAWVGRLNRGTHTVELTSDVPGEHMVIVQMAGVIVEATTISFE